MDAVKHRHSAHSADLRWMNRSAVQFILRRHQLGQRAFSWPTRSAQGGSHQAVAHGRNRVEKDDLIEKARQLEVALPEDNISRPALNKGRHARPHPRRR